MTNNQIRKAIEMIMRQMQGHKAENIIIPLLDQVLAGLYHLGIPSFCMTLDHPAALKANRILWTAGTRIITGQPISISPPGSRVHLVASCETDPEEIAYAACFADVIARQPGKYQDPSNEEFRARLEAAFCPPAPRYRGDVDY
jgi:hypothetical protein